MNRQVFFSADILLPKREYEKWAVVACDQFTSEERYWTSVDALVGEAPSALRLILPEIYLEKEGVEERIATIQSNMEHYLASDIFTEERGMIYLERTMPDGSVRHGVVGAIDLSDYDFRAESHSLIRATEETVIERIPPRLRVREGAALELPHILLLINDPQNTVIAPLTAEKEDLRRVYDFELMMHSGRLTGYCLGEAHQRTLSAALEALAEKAEDGLLFVVGDGNHSLATAKAASETSDSPLAKQALVEIVNIHDPAIRFEPIYRVLFGVDEEALFSAFLAAMGGEYEGEDGQDFDLVGSGITRTVRVKPRAKLPVGTLQPFLDDYLNHHPEVRIDYIHGEETLFDLCGKAGVAGFIFKGMEKNELFEAVRVDGSLPRKTFSMGHACEKRFYMEARRIK